MLGISDEPVTKQQAYVSQVPVTYPLLTVTPGVPDFYREIAKYPAIFLIDREGRLHSSPNESQRFRNVEEAVDNLLNGGNERLSDLRLARFGADHGQAGS